MLCQVKYYLTSLGVHLGLLALMLALTANAVTHTPPITLDFTLAQCQVSEQPKERPRRPVTAVRQLPVASPSAPVKMVEVRPAAVPEIMASQSPGPFPTLPASNRAVAAHVPLQNSNAPSAFTTASETNSLRGEERITPEKAQQLYLKDQLSYIRSVISKNLIYPSIARRMEWTGRVVLSFVVAEDGRIHSIRVKETSGYPVLDNSALQTVKNIGTFPRPPVAVELVFPVTFNLQ
ncbi:MAG: energy transducer TonB [Desulfuromonadaceae bacterium]|nr:energy transducer TonB [Desulfuromonadaceae bacterium]